MTTHDQQLAAETAQPLDPEASRAPAEVSEAQSDSRMPTAGPAPSADTAPTHETMHPAETAPTAETMPSAEPMPSGETEPGTETETVPRSAQVEPSSGDMLFAVDPSGLRSRWDDIQAAFVDDPSACVQQADGLVEEVIGQLTSRFADARSQLEAQWARGETASTEDLRVALTRYREFFNRLLSV